MALLEILNSDLPSEEVNKKLDQFFGIDPIAIENSFQTEEKDETYRGLFLNPEALFTSYKDYQNILETLQENETLVDIGAGIGRGSLIAPSLNRKCLSLEVVKERIKASNANNQEDLIHIDLLKEPLPQANAYFLYQPVGNFLFHILGQLLRFSAQRKIKLFVIESHGDLIPFLSSSGPWLELKEKRPLVSERHDQSLYVFESRDPSMVSKFIHDLLNFFQEIKDKEFYPFQNIPKEFFNWLLIQLRSQRDLDLLIKDDTGIWLSSCLTMDKGIEKETLQSYYPFRIHPFKEILAIVKAPKELINIRERRFLKEDVRKIFIFPTPSFSKSNGERETMDIKWKQPKSWVF